jgi:MFS family permease
LVQRCVIDSVQSVLLLFLAGAVCSGQALAFAVVRDNNEDTHIAAAIGFNNMAVVIAGAIFQPLLGALITDQSRGHYQGAVAILVVTSVVGALLACFLIRSKRYG